MATVINNPSGTSESSGVSSLVMGLLILAAVLLLIFYVGVPALRNATRETVGPGGVPEQIDVNVNTPN